MREWFESLAVRERWMVGAGGVVAALTLYFLIVWEPLASGVAQRNVQVQESRELTSFLGQTAAEVAKSSGRKPSSIGSGNRSLLAVVDTTGKQAGLATAIKRIQPDGDNTVRLWLEDAEFDTVMRWLGTLQQQHGITLSSGNLDKDARPGRIKARISLERTAT